MGCNALDIAQYIVNYYIKKNRPITNLQLQKLLYFAWIEYFKAKGISLFDDVFEAWPLGPVIPCVYYDFCAYGADMIFRKRDVTLSGVDLNILDKCLNQYVGRSAYDLVSLSHRSGGAWEQVYNNGSGYKQEMDFEIIKRLECGVF